MTIEKKENERYVYITYSSKEYNDIEKFEKFLSSFQKNISSKKDIVIDFRQRSNITSPEFGAIIKLSHAARF